MAGVGGSPRDAGDRLVEATADGAEAPDLEEQWGEMSHGFVVAPLLQRLGGVGVCSKLDDIGLIRDQVVLGAITQLGLLVE